MKFEANPVTYSASSISVTYHKNKNQKPEHQSSHGCSARVMAILSLRRCWMVSSQGVWADETPGAITERDGLGHCSGLPLLMPAWEQKPMRTFEDSLKQCQAASTRQAKRQCATARQCYTPYLGPPSLWSGLHPCLRGHKGTPLQLTAHGTEEEEGSCSSASTLPLPNTTMSPGSREEHVFSDFQAPNSIIHQHFTLIRNFSPAF